MYYSILSWYIPTVNRKVLTFLCSFNNTIIRKTLTVAMHFYLSTLKVKMIIPTWRKWNKHSFIKILSVNKFKSIQSLILVIPFELFYFLNFPNFCFKTQLLSRQHMTSSYNLNYFEVNRLHKLWIIVALTLYLEEHRFE